MFGSAETEYIQLTGWFVGHTTCVCGQDLGANHSLIGRLIKYLRSLQKQLTRITK
jgi:hypothetical protein